MSAGLPRGTVSTNRPSKGLRTSMRASRPTHGPVNQHPRAVAVPGPRQTAVNAHLPLPDSGVSASSTRDPPSNPRATSSRDTTRPPRQIKCAHPLANRCDEPGQPRLRRDVGQDGADKPLPGVEFAAERSEVGGRVTVQSEVGDEHAGRLPGAHACDARLPRAHVDVGGGVGGRTYGPGRPGFRRCRPRMRHLTGGRGSTGDARHGRRCSPLRSARRRSPVPRRRRARPGGRRNGRELPQSRPIWSP